MGTTVTYCDEVAESVSSTESSVLRSSLPMEPATQIETYVLTAVDVSTSAAVSQRVDTVTCTEVVLLLKLELANERVAIANERAKMAIEREAMAVQRVAEAERWSYMCEARIKVMASDAERVLGYTNEAARCLSLVRDVERRWVEESNRCQLLCQEAEHRVSNETQQRLAAEEHAAAVERSAMKSMEQRVNVVIQHARLRAEADNKMIAIMEARICELENGSDERQQLLAAGAERHDAESIEQREAASVRADKASKLIDAPLQCADGDTAVVEISELDRAGPTVQSGTEMVPGVGVAVRSYAATLRLPAIIMERDK